MVLPRDGEEQGKAYILTLSHKLWYDRNLVLYLYLFPCIWVSEKFLSKRGKEHGYGVRRPNAVKYFQKNHRHPTIWACVVRCVQRLLIVAFTVISNPENPPKKRLPIRVILEVLSRTHTLYIRDHHVQYR